MSLESASMGKGGTGAYSAPPATSAGAAARAQSGTP